MWGVSQFSTNGSHQSTTDIYLIEVEDDGIETRWIVQRKDWLVDRLAKTKQTDKGLEP